MNQITITRKTLPPVSKDGKFWPIFGAVALLFLTSLLYFVLTVPVIEKLNRPGDVSTAGGGYSEADVAYYDYRPTITRGEAADVWWGTKDGRWRRLEWYNGFTRSTGTTMVLRDVAYPGSWFGLQQDSAGSAQMQHLFQDIEEAYQRQSIFDRVPLWRVQKIR